MKRAIRELVVGVTLALAFGGVATAVLSESFDQQPRLAVSNETESSTNGANIDPDGIDDLDRPLLVTPRVPTTKGELRLVKVFEPFDLARGSESAYSVVTLAQLGQQFPAIGFVRPDRPSMSEGEVSVLIASPETLILATLDATGCVWLHELGGGPEITHSEDPSMCSASNSPIDGWAGITSA